MTLRSSGKSREETPWGRASARRERRIGKITVSLIGDASLYPTSSSTYFTRFAEFQKGPARMR
jgi:hypothetical protein